MVFLGFVATFARTGNSLELIFCDTFAHGGSTGHTARDHLKQLIDIVSARPFLMFEDLYTILKRMLVTGLKLEG